MAHDNTVIHSFNLPGESVCVDVFHRPDGSFGFEEFRRDPEDMRGWYPIGMFSPQVFEEAEGALAAAKAAVHWLEDVVQQ
ncbi:hypothetical protein [Falsiphaeobacter marinintestinus]|uniref:hypothetical protein n=1 Tax=Falsiphaeobacter marinintestinus TaxID=1492905 RepID=UPI0011B4896B|nr:hypothetical protein [Phaeobacter marinintestinus]